MTKSATGGRERRQRTVERIVRSAQLLCLARGFSGFTLEELAADVGVSRRTLFNYVPDKEHAVLGPGPDIDLDDPDIACFRGGGPTGDLVRDLAWVLQVAVRQEPGLAENLDRVGRLIKAQPSLLPRFMAHMENATRQVRDIIIARPGETPDRASVATAILLALLHTAARESVAAGTPLPEAVRRVWSVFESLTLPDRHPHH